PTGPLILSGPTAICNAWLPRAADRVDAARTQMVGVPYCVRARAGRNTGEPSHHHPAPRTAGPEPTEVYRPERRDEPGAAKHQRQTSRPHGASGREEGRAHPRRRRLRVHGEGSEKAKAVARTKTRGARTGY